MMALQSKKFKELLTGFCGQLMQGKIKTIAEFLFWADAALCFALFYFKYPDIEPSAIIATAIVFPAITVGLLALPTLILLDIYNYFTNKKTRVNASSSQKNAELNMTLSNASSLLSKALHNFSEKSEQYYSTEEGKERFDSASTEVDKAYAIYRQVVDQGQNNNFSKNTINLENEAGYIVSKFLHEAGIAKALCSEIAEHVDDWGFEAERYADNPIDYTPELYFDGKITNMSLINGEDYGDKKLIINFKFNGNDYVLSLKRASESFMERAELELVYNNKTVANLDLYGNFHVEFVGKHDVCIQDWRFGHANVFHVGPWMKDVLDIASQIKANKEIMFDEADREYDAKGIKL
jgi:hypothetical protein